MIIEYIICGYNGVSKTGGGSSISLLSLLPIFSPFDEASSPLDAPLEGRGDLPSPALWTADISLDTVSAGATGTGLWGGGGMGLKGGRFKLMMVLAEDVLTMLLRFDSGSSMSMEVADNLFGLRLLRSTNVPDCRLCGAGDRDRFPPGRIATANSSGFPPLARRELDEEAPDTLLIVEPGRERVCRSLIPPLYLIDIARRTLCPNERPMVAERFGPTAAREVKGREPYVSRFWSLRASM